MRDDEDDLKGARRKAMRKGAAMLIYFGVMIASISVAFEYTLYASEGGGLGVTGVLAGVLILLAGVALGVYSFMAGRK